MAKAIVALRAMLKPMREMALRRSVKRLPLGFRAAEFASCSRRAASAGSALTMRTTRSDVDQFVGQRAAYARGHFGKARQVDLLTGKLDVQRFDEACQFRLARVRGTLRRRH